MFVNPSTGDLHLVSNSATQANVIDKVAPLSNVTTDWDGDSRPQGANADIGADEYRTADTTAPTVTTESPTDDATNVPVNTTVTATFSEAVQSSTISMTLTDSAGHPVSSTVSYNASTFVVTLSPSSALGHSTTYTMSLSRAQDMAGNTMSPDSCSFSTAAQDTTPPTVTSSSPASGATGVAVSTAVTATFNESVRCSR